MSETAKNIDFRLGSTGSPSTLVDLSSLVRSAGYDLERALIEANEFNSSGAKKNLKGLYGAKFPVKFFYTPALFTQLHAAVLGDNTVNIQFGPKGSTTGLPKYTGAVHIHGLSSPVELDNVMEVTAEITLDGAISVGTFA